MGKMGMARDQVSGWNWAWPAGLDWAGLLGRRAWAWAELHALRRRPALWPTGPRPLHKQTRHDLQTLGKLV